MIELSEKDGAVIFNVRVVPRASKTTLAGELDGAVKVRLAAPPVDGAANAELVAFFAKLAGVPKSNVEIVGGLASKNKRVRIDGVGLEIVRELLI